MNVQSVRNSRPPLISDGEVRNNERHLLQLTDIKELTDETDGEQI